jgi:hypothetical protein
VPARRRTFLFAILLGVAIAAPVFVAAKRSQISVEVTVGFSCVTGAGPRRSEVIVTLKSGEGAMRDRVVTRTDRFGFWGACFRLFSPSTYVNGGDQLKVKIGDDVRRIDVPRLQPQIDRVRDVIEGWSTPHSHVDIAVTHHRDFRHARDFFFSATADARGHFKIDTTGTVDLLGWDSVEVFVSRGSDLFGALAVVPGMQVAVVSNNVLGYVNDGTRLRIAIRDPDGRLRGSVTAGPFLFGGFEVVMFKKNGEALYPRANDTLRATFATDAVMKIPASRLRGSAETDTVRGRCIPNEPYQLIVRGRVFYGTADAQGNLIRNVGNKINLRRGDDLTLYCQFPSGDVWQDLNVAL